MCIRDRLAPAQEAFVASIDLSLFGIEAPDHPLTTAPSTEGSIVAPEEPTQPAVTQEPTDTQSETQAQITADGTETTPTAQTQAPEIADTGDSLVVGGAVLASLAACGLLIVTRKKK